jgi:uncharacterized protein with HEPN domain
MSKRNDRDSLSDIREAINRITTYVTGKTYISFVADTKTQDAVIRNLEILGEAAKNPSGPFGLNIQVFLGRVWREFAID